MRYIAAYLLLSMSGKKNITVEDMKVVLESVKAPIEEDKLQAAFKSCTSGDISELMAQGKGMFATIACGAAPAAGSAASATAAPAEEKKEEEKKEEEEEEADLGLDLFG